MKNRFGAADEVGCFLMHDGGIEGVADPSGLFLEQRAQPVPGTAVTVTLDGKRPLIGEIQALLTSPPTENTPRRTVVSGIDQARVAMITAVIHKRARVPVGMLDIYLSTVGGMRLTDPSSDLAVAAAMASAASGRPLPAGAVVFGEIGLAGDLRRVTGMDRRGSPRRRAWDSASQSRTSRLRGAARGSADSGVRHHRRRTAGARRDQQAPPTPLEPESGRRPSDRLRAVDNDWL